jgi:hypothetical protein
MTHDEQAQAIVTFGFTARQAAFLAVVIRYAGVCLARQYCAYAGIVRGQKTHDFFGTLVAQRYATAYSGGPRQARIYHVHHKGLYRAIGEPDARFRKPLAVARAVERLIVLDHVLAHRDLLWLASEREKVEYFGRTTTLRREELPALTFTGGGTKTTRYFPDKLPIGVSSDRRRHVLVYLVTQDVPLDFRAFLHRHAELLRDMGFPTLEVVAALKKKSELLNWTSILVALEIQSVSEIPSRGDHIFQIHDFLGVSTDWPVALGRHIARFHNAGFVHGDLKTRHILVNFLKIR